MALTGETPWYLAGSWEMCYKLLHSNLSTQVCKYYTFIYYGNKILYLGAWSFIVFHLTTRRHILSSKREFSLNIYIVLMSIAFYITH